MDAYLDVKKISKSFHDKTVLNGLSFSVSQGESFALLGPNGAGKSTFIKIFATLIKPDSGTITIDGKDFFGRYNGFLLRQIEFVSQQRSIYQDLSVKDNFMFFGTLLDLNKNVLRSRIDNLLTLTELHDSYKKKVRELSGGMQQKLHLALALLSKPTILIMDEPTVGLDVDAQNKVWEIIRKVKADGTTIVFTTHYLKEAELYADRIAFLHDGAINTCGSFDELRKQSRLTNIMRITFYAEERETLQNCLKMITLKHGKNVWRADDTTLCMETGEESFELSAYTDLIAQYSKQIQSLEIDRPSLENLYLFYTGKAFQNAKAEGLAHV